MAAINPGPLVGAISFATLSKTIEVAGTLRDNCAGGLFLIPVGRDVFDTAKLFCNLSATLERHL